MATDDKGNDAAGGKSGESTGKRPYAKPRLQEYGSIAKLTQSGGTTKPEGTMRRTCL